MARRSALPLFLLALSCLSWCAVTVRTTPSAGADAAAAAPAANGSFIRSWCAGTQYPALCNATLTPYAAEVGASPARLSLAALNVTLDAGKKAKAAMKAFLAAATNVVPEAARQAAEDCVDMLDDAVDLLQQSVDVMVHLGKEQSQSQSGQAGSGRYVRFEVNSVQTWASAALTNGDTCMEGFKGQAAAVRETVRASVAGLMHLTSNALAIINAMAKQIS